MCVLFCFKYTRFVFFFLIRSYIESICRLNFINFSRVQHTSFFLNLLLSVRYFVFVLIRYPHMGWPNYWSRLDYLRLDFKGIIVDVIARLITKSYSISFKPSESRGNDGNVARWPNQFIYDDNRGSPAEQYTKRYEIMAGQFDNSITAFA